MESGLPPAPKIDGEAMLEIFVHRSLCVSGTPMNTDSLYGDGRKLRMIGHHILNAAYSILMFDKKPMLTAAEMLVCRATRL